MKPFVSYIHDDDSDEESDSSSDSVLMTPRLKEHSRRMIESDEKQGGTPYSGIPLNLAKRLSSSVSTSKPNPILQVAFENVSTQNDFNRTGEEETHPQELSIFLLNIFAC